jgi:hypothetical protein
MSNSKAEQPQIDKFRDLARELEADEDEAAFEDVVKKVAKAPAVKTSEPPSDG